MFGECLIAANDATHVSKLKCICKCGRSGPKSKVLTKSLDVYDRDVYEG